MVRSEHLFSHENLQILIKFIFSVAPALDAMAGTIQCARLTSLLEELKTSPTEWTIAGWRDIAGLCRNLSRAFGIVVPSPSSEQVKEETNEYKAVEAVKT